VVFDGTPRSFSAWVQALILSSALGKTVDGAAVVVVEYSLLLHVAFKSSCQILTISIISVLCNYLKNLRNHERTRAHRYCRTSEELSSYKSHQYCNYRHSHLLELL